MMITHVCLAPWPLTTTARRMLCLAALVGMTLVSSPGSAQMASVNAASNAAAGSEAAPDPVSPALRIKRDPPPPPQPAQPVAGYRSLDGSGNSAAQPTMGQANTPLARMAPAAYGDGISSLAGANRPSPRVISNIVNTQTTDRRNQLGLTDFMWQWGQFLDHDLDLTDGVDPPEPVPIAVPSGDRWFDPTGTGTKTISFNRTIYDTKSGTDRNNPRQQINEITSWIDASQVYGSTVDRAKLLRTFAGGKLKTSEGNFLPFNEAAASNAGGAASRQFLAGDVRVNEQPGLIALHTLFVREHNRITTELAAANPVWDDETLYQQARRIVGAQMQAITYFEFLPLLLGPGALPPYNGYRPDVDARITNEFAAAAYRLGHTLLSSRILRIDAGGNPIPQGHLTLRDAFFVPQKVIDEGGIDPILRGMTAQLCQDLDIYVIDDVRNFLFGAPGSGGFDLPALNIQRGRDHGLPSYNQMRRSLQLRPAATFAEISRDPEVQRRLQQAYGNPEAVDLWVGALAENHLPGALVGELLHALLRRQFAALRDGDRYWFEGALPRDQAEQVRRTRLSDIIRRNTGIGGELPGDVWHLRRP